MPEVTIQTVAPHWIAAASGIAPAGNVSGTMLELIGQAWAHIRAAGLKSDGINVAIYRGDPAGVRVEAGAGVFEPFQGSATVSCIATPAGRAATAAHIGPYRLMGRAHSAIVEYCRQHGLKLEGTNWEIYGHWTDDETKLRTDIYYLLTAES